ncbi:hypothetical protein BC826DRAFT_1102692 [Russula brevipes]|nr:hypothetical protein BC826DRAFT_1102692 [Russula brevipes]
MRSSVQIAANALVGLIISRSAFAAPVHGGQAHAGRDDPAVPAGPETFNPIGPDPTATADPALASLLDQLTKGITKAITFDTRSPDQGTHARQFLEERDDGDGGEFHILPFNPDSDDVPSIARRRRPLVFFKPRPPVIFGPGPVAIPEQALSAVGALAGPAAPAEPTATVEPTAPVEPTATVEPDTSVTPTATVEPDPPATVEPDTSVTVTVEPTATVEPDPTATVEPDTSVTTVIVEPTATVEPDPAATIDPAQISNLGPVLPQKGRAITPNGISRRFTKLLPLEIFSPDPDVTSGPDYGPRSAPRTTSRITR